MDNRLLRLLAPLTAAAMVLVIVAVTLNVRITNEVDDLKQENASLQASLNSAVATITAQISQAAANESEVMDTVLQLQKASYELAQPNSMSLDLRSPISESTSQGILLVSRDGPRDDHGRGHASARPFHGLPCLAHARARQIVDRPGRRALRAEARYR